MTLTPQEIAEMDQMMGTKTITDPTKKANKSFADSLRTIGKEKVIEKDQDAGIFNSVKEFGQGVAKEGLSTIKGLGKLGADIGNIPLKIAGMETSNPYGEEELKKSAEKGEFSGKLLNEENLKAKTGAEKLGKFVGGVAEFAIPGSKVTKATEGANLLTKMLTRGVTSAGVASAQKGEVGKEAITAGVIDAAIPGIQAAAKPVVNFLGKMFKGLGSGLSGTPDEVVTRILKDPKEAKILADQIDSGKGVEILRENANKVINGVSKIRQDARTAYRAGVETLKATDIEPKTFRKGVQSILDKYKISTDGTERILENVEFSDPKNLQKASNLIDELGKVELNGNSLNKLADKIENVAFKTATTDERLSFNAFIRDLSKNLTDTIGKATPKLKEINSAYSKDLQLTEAIESIFKDVEFKNLDEINGVARKLETLFTKSGLDPTTIDDFLTKIGDSPDKFRLSEAVRQISSKTGANATGLNMQDVTKAVMDPKFVRDMAIRTGLTIPKIKSAMEKINTIDPELRAIIINALTNEN